MHQLVGSYIVHETTHSGQMLRQLVTTVITWENNYTQNN